MILGIISLGSRVWGLVRGLVVCGFGFGVRGTAQVFPVTTNLGSIP